MDSMSMCEVVAHPHDRALAELLLDLAQRGIERLVPFCFGHPSLLCECCCLRTVCVLNPGHPARHRVLTLR